MICEAFSVQMEEKDGLDPYRKIISEALGSRNLYIFSHYWNIY